jgi:hypothetical protein
MLYRFSLIKTYGCLYVCGIFAALESDIQFVQVLKGEVVINQMFDWLPTMLLDDDL